MMGDPKQGTTFGDLIKSQDESDEVFVTGYEARAPEPCLRLRGVPQEECSAGVQLRHPNIKKGWGNFRHWRDEPDVLPMRRSKSVASGARPSKMFVPGVDWGERLETYAEHVSMVGVSTLEGYNLNLALFEKSLPLCVEAGLVSQEHADYVLDGLRHGFDLGINHKLLTGRRVFKNYTSAYEHKDKVQKALQKRVKTGKTLKLGAFSGDPRDLPMGGGVVVPQGAVPKKMEPESVRPISDDTKTGLNAAVDLSGLQHTLNTYYVVQRDRG